MSGSDNDMFFDDDDDFEEIRREAEERSHRERRAQREQLREPIPQPRAPVFRSPIEQAMPTGWRNAFNMLGGAGGFPRGHPFGGGHPSASMFRADYKAWSTSIFEAQEGRMGHVNGGRQNLMFGGNILMPPDALDVLTQMDIEPPWNFELINPKARDKTTHCGVLEFTAPRGVVYLPQWMMTQLGLEEGDPLRVNGAALPKGKFIKLQPQELVFLELSDPKAVLERALPNFPCLSVGDIIEISHQHIHLSFLIMEAKAQGGPQGSGQDAKAINILNTDIEVDFAPPVGYVEPERRPRTPPPTMAQKLGIDVNAKEEHGSSAEAAQKVDAFVGIGHSLGGKRVRGKGTRTKKIEAVEEGSKIERTDRQRFINANAMDTGNKSVPAPLRLPFGHLFFGYPVKPVKVDSAAAPSQDENAATPKPTFTGQGATLSGRMRQLGTSDSSGSRNGKKPPREVIEID